jgi:hyperosmotically inducible protein
MFRALLRLVVVLVVLVGVGAFFLGWWGSGRVVPIDRPLGSVGTAGHIDTQKAKEVGAEVGAKTAAAANKASEKTAEAVQKAGEVLTDGALTAKIKSKMALDDLVKARSIDVTTTNHVVTLKGTVGSVAEHDRAVQLAKETAGITEVVDHLRVAAR